MGLKRIEHSGNLYRTSKSGLIDPDRHVRGPGITPSRIFDMKRGSQMYLIRSVSLQHIAGKRAFIEGWIPQASSETTHQYIFIILHLKGHLGCILPSLYFSNSFRGNANNSHFESFFPGIPPPGGVPH